MTKTHSAIALAVVLCAASAGPAAAAPAQSARQHAGEEVIVTQSASGDVLRGRLVDLSPVSLAILVGGRRVDVPIDNVLRIDTTHDSVRNGTIIGAVVLGGWCAAICGQGIASGGSLATAVAINAGVGTLIGAGIDALHKGRSPIYIKTPGKAGSALQVRLKF